VDTQELRDLLSLDRDDPTPLYHQIERQLAGLIERGTLEPGARIPGDVEMSQTLDVNSRTVRHALARLVAKGLIHRVRRSGTFVSASRPPARDTIAFFYFAENALAMTQRAEAIQQYAARHGADFKMVAFPKDFYEKVDLLEEARRMGLRGLIAVPLGNEACKRNLLRLEAAGFPYVRLGNTYFTGQLKAPLVCGDFPRAVRFAMQYLWAFGHRRIGFIVNTHLGEYQQEYSEFSRSFGPFPERWKLALDYDGTLEMLAKLPTDEILDAYLRDNPELTAVCTTVLGQKLAVIARSKGRRIPDTFSIVSLATAPAPGGLPLTSMRVSIRPMGESAAHKLFEIIHRGPPAQEEIIQIPLDLIEGESVAAPPIGR